MRPVFPALALIVVALAACSRAESPASPPEVAGPAPVLSGVDLAQPVRVSGTEPFWTVELTGTEMVYTTLQPPEQRGPQPIPVVQGTTVTYETETAAGTGLTVTLVATECSDGMSDRTYPLAALVKLGDTELTGCAASTAAVLSAGESGPVR